MVLEYRGVDISFDPYFDTLQRAFQAPAPAASQPSQNGTLAWEGLSFSVPHAGTRGGRKVLLNEISGAVRAGQMLAIMGPSGSGKTSLLKLLAGRAAARNGADVRGRVLVDGRPRHSGSFSQRAGYVQQDDDMFAELTVAEQVGYAAALRLPSSLSREDRRRRARDVIDELGLAKVRSSVIGNEQVHGVSGGERKRASIATELVTDYPFLFLDEPTSGLDAFNALNVVSTLRRLATMGRTVVCTIHQPRSSIFQLFDLVLLLSEGNAIYFGQASQALSYFEALKFRSPVAFNPADFLLDVVSIDSRSPDLEANTRARVSYLAKVASAENKRDLSNGESHDDSEGSENALRTSGDDIADAMMKLDSKSSSLGFQRNRASEFWILASRAFRVAARSKVANIVRAFQTILFGIVISLLWGGNGRSDALVNRKSLVGAAFFMCINQSITSVFSVIFAFPVERSVVERERASASYRASSYYVSKMLTELPRTVIYTGVFTTLTYFSIGFKQSASAFFRFYLVIFLVAAFSESLAITVSIATGSAQIAGTVAPIGVFLSLLFAGFFTQASQIPPWLQWIKWISYIFYGFNAIAKVEFPGRPFAEEIMSNAGFNDLSYWENIGGLIGVIAVIRSAGFLALRYARKPSFLRL